jgi:hypothetical protein
MQHVSLARIISLSLFAFTSLVGNARAERLESPLIPATGLSVPVTEIKEFTKLKTFEERIAFLRQRNIIVVTLAYGDKHSESPAPDNGALSGEDLEIVHDLFVRSNTLLSKRMLRNYVRGLKPDVKPEDVNKALERNQVERNLAKNDGRVVGRLNVEDDGLNDEEYRKIGKILGLSEEQIAQRALSFSQKQKIVTAIYSHSNPLPFLASEDPLTRDLFSERPKKERSMLVLSRSTRNDDLPGLYIDHLLSVQRVEKGREIEIAPNVKRRVDSNDFIRWAANQWELSLLNLETAKLGQKEPNPELETNYDQAVLNTALAKMQREQIEILTEYEMLFVRWTCREFLPFDKADIQRVSRRLGLWAIDYGHQSPLLAFEAPALKPPMGMPLRNWQVVTRDKRLEKLLADPKKRATYANEITKLGNKAKDFSELIDSVQAWILTISK